MEKNFQDILNEKIGKQESKLHQHSASLNSESSLCYSLLFHLHNNLNISVAKVSQYSVKKDEKERVSFKEEKPVHSHLQEEVSTEIFGFFPSTQSIVEAKLFFNYHGQKIPEECSMENLKRKFRTLAKRLHPDMSTGSNQDFIQLRKHFKSLEKAWQPYLEAA